jgi:hypothetical protein
MGILVFVAAVVGVVVAVYLALAGSGDSGSGRASSPTPSTTVAPTTTTLKPAGPFVLTDGVNVRTGPGTTFPSRGTITTGTKVLVVCATDGQTIDGPKGPTSKWVEITGTTPVGYVTNQYVATGAAIDDPKVIPICPPS